MLRIFSETKHIMYALHTKKESAHNDSIWCCDWRQIKHEKETSEEGGMDTQVTEVEEIIVTGGVDDVVKIWNYRDGELEYKHQLTDHSLGVVSTDRKQNYYNLQHVTR